LEWAVFSEEDVAAAGIRNLREVNNAERDVVRVRRWSIVPRRNSDTKPAGGLERMLRQQEFATCGR